MSQFVIAEKKSPWAWPSLYIFEFTGGSDADFHEATSSIERGLGGRYEVHVDVVPFGLHRATHWPFRRTKRYVMIRNNRL